MKLETVFTVDAATIKYGAGVTREVGYDMRRLGCRRVMILTDAKMVDSEPVTSAMEALTLESIEVALYDRVRVEPTDLSLKDAIRSSSERNFDGYVAVGGGSTMDTAKVVNLYSSYPAPFLSYVHRPIGEGHPVPGPLKPLIAIPTTAGTGSETTGVAAFDFHETHTKAAIAHSMLRPTLGLVDPNNIRTVPRVVAACAGLDVLCGALEAITALPYSQRPAPANPSLRPVYQGSNPISDVWAAQAIQIVSQNLVHMIENPSDDDARDQMMMAASFGRVGIGNAGVHLPHAMSYPVSCMVREYIPEGYSPDHPIIPHGMSVALNAPSAFRFTAKADPRPHLHAAELMGLDTSTAHPKDAGELLASAIVDLMRRTDMPNGLSAVGYQREDIPKLVTGTLAQERVTRLSPRSANEADLRQLFIGNMTHW